MLRRDVANATSGRIFYCIGTQQIPQKHRYFADFMPKVVIGGNKVTIKTPLIATRYPLIIKELSISVANVALN